MSLNDTTPTTRSAQVRRALLGRMSMRAAGTLLAMLAVSTVSWAAGQDPAAAAPAGQVRPASVDADGDGSVSAQEHERAAKLMFQRLDVNGDGSVGAAEMDARLPGAGGGNASAQVTSAERIKLLDSDGDGLLSQAEHGAGAQRMFAQLDANQDGRVSPEEHEAARAEVKKRAGDQ